MKNLLKLGEVLNRAEQKNVNGGGGFGFETPPDPCLTDEDCWYLTGDYTSQCNARTGRCIIFN